MGAFERSKWLREGMIYLELLLCCALESLLLMCAVEMAFSRGEIGSFRGDAQPRYHQPDTCSSLCASFHSACHLFHTCSTHVAFGTHIWERIGERKLSCNHNIVGLTTVKMYVIT